MAPEEDRNAKFDAIFHEFIHKVNSLMERFDEFKKDLKESCRLRETKCHTDFEGLYERMRAAETNIIIAQTMADTLGKAIDALRERGLKTVHITLLAIYALAHTAGVVYLIITKGGAH